MPALRSGHVGIMPPGALGVAMFYHLTRQATRLDHPVHLLQRPGSRSGARLRETGSLRLLHNGALTALPLRTHLRGDLLDGLRNDHLPEVVLVATNPDQLNGVITNLVELSEALFAREPGAAPEALAEQLPILVFCANGIYFQRLRQIYLEKLEESTLLGRLPDLWPEAMPRIISRILRGVTLQTGLREGTGATALYRPGPPGQTIVAGSHEPTRARACAVLQHRGGWFDDAGSESPTRVEFQKALINLSFNLIGMIHCIDAGSGHFGPQRVGDVLDDSNQLAEARALAESVVEIGKAVRAYGPEESFETIFAQLKGSAEAHRGHVPSSIQLLEQRLRTGELRAEVTPTEGWLINPLIHYARNSELPEVARHLEDLKGQLIQRLQRAIDHYGLAAEVEPQE